MDPYTYPQWDRSALLTIDVQRDVTLPDAPFRIPGTLEAVPAMKSVVEAYRRAMRPIVHVVRLYLTDGSNVDLCRRAMIEAGKRIAAPGDQGSQIVEDLLLRPSLLDPETLLKGGFQELGPLEWAMYKPRFGSFYNTDLEDHLRRLGITTVVVVGCNFPNCPRTTVYEAGERDFRIVMVKDAMSGIYDRGLEELKNIGVNIMTATEIIPAVETTITT